MSPVPAAAVVAPPAEITPAVWMMLPPPADDVMFRVVLAWTLPLRKMPEGADKETLPALDVMGPVEFNTPPLVMTILPTAVALIKLVGLTLLKLIVLAAAAK